MHRRDEIKELFKSILIGKTEACDNVQLMRFYPLQREKDYPLINIFCMSEKVNEVLYPHSYDVSAKIAVSVFTRHARGQEDQLDKITQQIMTEILKFKSLEFEITYDGTEIEGDGEGLNTNLAAVITYDVRYMQVFDFEKEADDMSGFNGKINTDKGDVEFSQDRS